MYHNTRKYHLKALSKYNFKQIVEFYYNDISMNNDKLLCNQRSKRILYGLQNHVIDDFHGGNTFEKLNDARYHHE